MSMSPEEARTGPDSNEIDPNTSPPSVKKPRGFRNAVILPSIVALSGVVSLSIPRLWTEYQALKREWDVDRRGRVIGFREINPIPSYALAPKNWFEVDGETVRLWSGWNRKKKSQEIFTFAKGEIDPDRLSHGTGRDSIRAIDRPIYEEGSGDVWKAIPDEAKVVFTEFDGVAVAYPIQVLNKVFIINDKVYSRPILVVYTPFEDEANSVCMFDPIVNGVPLVMGHSGYLYDSKPLLYDHQNEGLWVPQARGLKALTGPLKGTILNRMAWLEPSSWGSWKDEHPAGRLLIGAERTKPGSVAAK